MIKMDYKTRWAGMPSPILWVADTMPDEIIPVYTPSIEIARMILNTARANRKFHAVIRGTSVYVSRNKKRPSGKGRVSTNYTYTIGEPVSQVPGPRLAVYSGIAEAVRKIRPGEFLPVEFESKKGVNAAESYLVGHGKKRGNYALEVHVRGNWLYVREEKYRRRRPKVPLPKWVKPNSRARQLAGPDILPPSPVVPLK